MVTRGRRAGQRDAGWVRRQSTLGVVMPVLGVAALMGALGGAVMLSAVANGSVAMRCP